jgi:hypothetical protein
MVCSVCRLHPEKVYDPAALRLRVVDVPDFLAELRERQVDIAGDGGDGVEVRHGKGGIRGGG